MKGKRVLFAAAGIAILLCSGCAQDEGKSSSATTVPESFLKEVFTTDFENDIQNFRRTMIQKSIMIHFQIALPRRV